MVKEIDMNAAKKPVPVLFDNASECCGCGACAERCPTNAIDMVEDGYGYRVPIINEDLCVRCGACKKTCGFQGALRRMKDGLPLSRQAYTPLCSYASCAKDGAPQSASGGAFAEIAKAVLATGGVVYGAAYHLDADGLHVRHRRVETVDELLPLLGSKYVQSEAMLSYSDVERDLVDGLTVVFSGTPCQIAGLFSYLRHDYGNLLTIDLVCHGVPGEEMLRGYAERLEGLYGSRVVDFRFRCKRDGWDKSLLLITRFEDGRELAVSASNSSYYDLFLNLKTLRDSCYVCPYAGGVRPADISIGDYWGVQLRNPYLLEENGGKFSLDRGVSCMLVNSEHGRDCLERFGVGLTLTEVAFGDIAAGNDQLRAPAVCPVDRADYLTAFNRGGWESVESLWRRRTFFLRAKRWVFARVPKTVKLGLKRVLGKRPEL